MALTRSISILKILLPSFVSGNKIGLHSKFHRELRCYVFFLFKPFLINSTLFNHRHHFLRQSLTSFHLIKLGNGLWRDIQGCTGYSHQLLKVLLQLFRLLRNEATASHPHCCQSNRYSRSPTIAWNSDSEEAQNTLKIAYPSFTAHHLST